MQLWNDYEGQTLAGTFPIETLLRTEGRNASFATHDRNGRPAVLRLTEALNDQQEMRARYEAIQDLGQRNLVSIEGFGDVEIDGTPLIYLVMESIQENLGDILDERRLTIEETGEVATSLVAALEALHAHSLVHGQVEPASVVAAGQVIKLRSDCVRPAPAGAEGERARAEDVFGLADVLHRSLTQQQLQDASDALALPEPYASIVRNVVRGSWGIEEVASEVRRFVQPAPSQPLQGVEDKNLVSDEALAAAEPSKPAVASSRRIEDGPGRKEPPGGNAQLPLEYGDASKEGDASEEDDAQEPNAGSRWRPSQAPKKDRMPMLVTVGVAGLCLLVLLVWHFSAGGIKGRANAAGLPTPATPIASTAPMAAATPDIARAVPTPADTHAVAAAPQRGQVWRVVAYTYNVQTQAQAKARLIAEQHRDLDPQVYSRTGHAPYLVTLGGPLTQQQAAAIRDRARRQGLARDVYMQNYSR